MVRSVQFSGYVAFQVKMKKASKSALSANGSVPMSSDLSMGTNKIVSLGAPTADADAATKLYVDTEIAAVGSSGGVGTLSNVESRSGTSSVQIFVGEIIGGVAFDPTKIYILIITGINHDTVNVVNINVNTPAGETLGRATLPGAFHPSGATVTLTVIIDKLDSIDISANGIVDFQYRIIELG